MAFVEAWGTLSDSTADKWDSRAKRAAELLCGQSGVIDMGCGLMNLKRHLSPDQTYIPVDGTSRGPDSIVCDFDLEDPPACDVPSMACLGLIEYLQDPQRFLNETARRYRIAVVSYCTTDAPNPLPRHADGTWLNAFDAPTMEDMFRQAGWFVKRREIYKRSQHIWLLGTEQSWLEYMRLNIQMLPWRRQAWQSLLSK